MFCIISMCLSLTSFNKLQKPPQQEAKEIIERAKELTSFIPDSAHNKKLICGALDSMEIFDLSRGGNIQLPKVKFALVIMPAESMDSMQQPGFKDNIQLMAFQSDRFWQTNQVVILLNAKIAEFTHDIDAKSTGLIHELLHALQAVEHFYNKDKMSYATIYADEKAAWTSQCFLYQKARPDMFEGISVNCNTFEFTNLENLTEEKQKILDPVTGDEAVKSLLMFAYCGDKFFEIMYKKK